MKTKKHKSIISKLTQEFVTINSLQKRLEVFYLIKINFNFVSFTYIFIKDCYLKTMIFFSILKGIVMSFHKKKTEFFFRDSNSSGKKLYISFATS